MSLTENTIISRLTMVPCLIALILVRTYPNCKCVEELGSYVIIGKIVDSFLALRHLRQSTAMNFDLGQIPLVNEHPIAAVSMSIVPSSELCEEGLALAIPAFSP